MDVDPSWTFDEYRAYEQARLNESLAEQRQARADGLEVDPKSEPHGGYRIACVWSDEITSEACALSARLAELVPGTPAYPYQAIHSSIGNISAPNGRLVDPDRNQGDRALLDRLAGAVEKALVAPRKLPMGAGWTSGRPCSPRGWRWCSVGPRLVTGLCIRRSMLPPGMTESTW